MIDGVIAGIIMTLVVLGVALITVASDTRKLQERNQRHDR